MDNDYELCMAWQDALNHTYVRGDGALCAEDWLLGILTRRTCSTQGQEFVCALDAVLDKISPCPIAARNLFDAACQRTECGEAHAPEVTDLVEALLSNPTEAMRLALERMRMLVERSIDNYTKLDKELHQIGQGLLDGGSSRATKAISVRI